jgi:S1-C subfamily serine protease
VPGTIDLEAGTFLFSTGGALVGLVIEREERLAIVPGETLIATANRLLLEGNRQVGRLGVEVQTLSPALAAATGASRGVVVTWVAPEGPADGRLRVGDVIETVDDYALETPEHWLARSVRLLPGDIVRLRVRRDRMVREFSVTAGPSTPSTTLELGIDMRELRGTGTEVVHVRPGSAAARAGMVAGDIVTSIGGIDAPAPTVVSRTFAKASQDRPLLVAVIRNGARRILVLGKE